jgi:hypothetical protein
MPKVRSQIFRKHFSKQILLDFIIKYSEKRKNQYIFSNISFKKAQYNEDIAPIIDYLKDFYYNAKKFYIQRKMNYKYFLTIIRQVCKFHCIPFTSNIKYCNSTYEIQYSIFIYEEK